MPETALARLKDSPAADRAKEELERYLMAQAERLLAGAGRTMGRSTAHLNAIADGSSPGFRALALDGARRISKGRGPLRAVVEAGAKQAKDKAAHALRDRLGRRGGTPGRGRPTVILESVDVGVPVKDAYNQWTRYRDFPDFAHAVTSAEGVDETTSNWNAKVLWSRRSWTVHITDQVPDERIVWTSEGDKGTTTRGVVTFHELAVDLTRVLLVIEYHPQGLVEKTANLWRAQGRRVRLDLKNYARFLTLAGGRPDGWRGEIRDGEPVDFHEEQQEPEDLTEDTGAEEPDEIDAGDTADLYDDESGPGVADDQEYEEDYEAEGEEADDGYEDEADDLDSDYEQAEPDEESEPGAERETARPRNRRGSRRSA
ncbi:SRPBCC family protein [Streptomyces sp. NPDC048269]|uniref:SRPBCC family protein n=1 Tax=Streptomyces sp. NPDC048269 TaxID=3155753 RepID=UPI00342CC24F